MHIHVKYRIVDISTNYEKIELEVNGKTGLELNRLCWSPYPAEEEIMILLEDLGDFDHEFDYITFEKIK